MTGAPADPAFVAQSMTEGVTKNRRSCDQEQEAGQDAGQVRAPWEQWKGLHQPVQGQVPTEVPCAADRLHLPLPLGLKAGQVPWA